MGIWEWFKGNWRQSRQVQPIRAHSFEPLEPRLLLSADSTGSPPLAAPGLLSSHQDVVVDLSRDLLSESPSPAMSPVTHTEMYQGVDVEPSTAAATPAFDPLGLPASFDLRSSGDVTSVKDQGAAGTCWIFASYGSLESTILVDSGASMDFSENHLKNYHDYDGGPTSGGNYFMSQAYLGRWDGPVLEVDDPYHDYDDRPSPGGPPQYYVREVLEFDTDDELKNGLMTYGAIATAMYIDMAYYNATSNTYYYSGSANANHAVTIVGWDDTRAVPGAPGPGAWLIKNSWGPAWGNAGYFWISYSDSRGANDGFCFCDAVAPNTYQKVYSHDYFGNVGSWAYAYGFNAFTATSDQDLRAVQFWTQADGASYDVRIYDTFSGATLTGLLGSATGTSTYAGAHTIDLPTPVHLTAGNDFYIYLHLTDGGSYPMAADWAVSGYNSSSTAGPGQSYYSMDGITWTDLNTANATANFCIKALVTATAAPEITVLGNGISISDGDVTPSSTDGTHFGSVAQGAAAISRTFTVRNDGAGTLGLEGITVPTGFTLTEGLPATLAPGAADTFTVRLDMVAAGTKSGNIIIRNDDGNEHPFNFAISGTVLGAEIRVGGNGWLIVDGDTTPWVTDGTDFGTIGLGRVPISRTFIVLNDGNVPLTTGPVVVPTGFTVTEALSPSVAPNSSDTFTVQLDTAVAGTKTGEISFTNNDADENPFNFRITGVVTDQAEITVLGNGVSITDGDTTPDVGDHTSFGSVPVGGTPISRTFTVRNDGAATLTLGAVTVPAGFTLTEGLSPSLAPGASDTFTVRLETTTGGIKTGDISITNNDSDENPFNFRITGRVATSEEPVAFADARLKAAIEETLGVSNPTPADMLGLIELQAWVIGIRDLEGLQYATNLTTLGLWGNPITSIAPLAPLTNLTWLHLGRNQFNDLSPLAGLTNLTTVWLDALGITNVTPLSGLTNLTFLDLWCNDVTDVSPLSALTNLTSLNLWGNNHLIDISGLSTLTNLTELQLGFNQISDISALAGMTKLTYLILGANNISDISALRDLTKLTYLDFIFCPISDISVLARMTDLETLYAVNNRITDVSALAGLTKLTRLVLDSNAIHDVSALSGLTKLAYLRLPNCQISDIAPLTGLADLTELDLVVHDSCL